MKNIFVLGGVTYDTIIHLNDFPTKRGTYFSNKSFNSIGGTGTGKAINLSKIGYNVKFHAQLGEDIEGSKIKKELKENNVDFYYFEDIAGTEKHTNIINKDGERISIYNNYSTFNPEIDEQKIKKLIDKSEIIIVNIINYTRKYLSYIKKQNKKIWVDIHDYDGKNDYHKDYIEYADYIFMSSDSIENYKEYMEYLINLGKEFVVCTHGKKGATLMNNNFNTINIPIINDFKFIDSNGAGDSFFSGFLYGFLNNYSLEKCMEYGTINAGLTIESENLYNKNINKNLLENMYKKYYQ